MLGLIFIKQGIIVLSPFPPLFRINNQRKGFIFPGNQVYYPQIDELGEELSETSCDTYYGIVRLERILRATAKQKNIYEARRRLSQKIF